MDEPWEVSIEDENGDCEGYSKIIEFQFKTKDDAQEFYAIMCNVNWIGDNIRIHDPCAVWVPPPPPPKPYDMPPNPYRMLEEIGRRDFQRQLLNYISNGKLER